MNENYDTRHEQIATDLQEKGWSVQADYFPENLTRALLADLQKKNDEGHLAQAAIGRAAAGTINENIRNDRTLWLRADQDAPQTYLAMMEELRRALNRYLYLGLFEFEAHYALYEAGGFYKKHLDSLAGTRNRIVSTVSYLTPAWTESDGGHLVLYDADDHERTLARILPAAGTLAIFMSEDIPHEVLPPARARASIAGWYRCNASGENRVDPGS